MDVENIYIYIAMQKRTTAATLPYYFVHTEDA